MSRIVSVNVGELRTVEFRGRIVSTGIYKFSVEGAVRVEGINVGGDDQADRRVHGGVDKAVYAYAWEDYEWWSGELGRTLPPGTFGDNLTTQGIDVGGAVVGQHWRIGDVTLDTRRAPSSARTPARRSSVSGPSSSDSSGRSGSAGRSF